MLADLHGHVLRGRITGFFRLGAPAKPEEDAAPDLEGSSKEFHRAAIRDDPFAGQVFKRDKKLGRFPDGPRYVGVELETAQLEQHHPEFSFPLHA